MSDTDIRVAPLTPADSNPTPPTKPKRILELDGLRGFAVIAVIVYHLTYFAHEGAFAILPGMPALPAIPELGLHSIKAVGINAVNVFFVISGFIITTLLLGEYRLNEKISLSAFYTRRFFRIVPPFAAYLLILTGLRAAGAILVSGSNLVFSALFLTNTGILDKNSFWFVGHTWSLSVEEQYYLIFPPLLCLALRYKPRIIVPLVCCLFGVCLLSQPLGEHLSASHGRMWMHVNFLSDFRFIIVGVLIALRGGPLLRFLKGKNFVVPLVLALFIVVGSMIDIPLPAYVTWMLFPLLVPVACGMFTMWFAQNPERCGILRTPLIQWLGACSYSIYLWQQLFTAPPNYYLGWHLSPSPFTVAAILLCAAFSHYAIERPSIYLGRRFSKSLSA